MEGKEKDKLVKMRKRCKLLEEHIIEEEKDQYAKRISKVVENLSKENKILNEQAFWEFRKKFQKKKEEPITAM